MHRIRRIMGVCPQHDILFDDLTAREHIRLYAGLKGVPSDSLEGLVQSRLSAVRLLKVADQRAGSYSGGMKRRLSMVISTIGDPQVVYLDEPTTGEWSNNSEIVKVDDSQNFTYVKYVQVWILSIEDMFGLLLKSLKRGELLS